MKARDIISNDFEVVGPVTDTPTGFAVELFERDDQRAGGHYRHALETGLLYHLKHRETGNLVGFMILKGRFELFGEGYPSSSYFAIEYVYILAEYQGAKLSRLLRQTASDIAQQWLTNHLASCGASKLVCMSSSHPTTVEGQQFVIDVDRMLREWCAEHFVAFNPSPLLPTTAR